MHKFKNNIYILLLVIIYLSAICISPNIIESIILFIFTIIILVSNYFIKSKHINSEDSNFNLNELLFILIYFLIYIIFQMVNQKQQLIPADYINIILLFLIPLLIFKIIFKESFFKINKNKLINTIPNLLISCLLLFIMLNNQIINYFKINNLSVMSFIVRFSLIFFMTFILVGVPEEYFFRGLIQNRFEKIINPYKAIIISSLLFAIYHLPYRLYQLNNLQESLISIISQQLIIGILFGYYWFKTKNIYSVACVHSFYNAILILDVIKFG